MSLALTFLLFIQLTTCFNFPENPTGCNGRTEVFGLQIGKLNLMFHIYKAQQKHIPVLGRNRLIFCGLEPVLSKVKKLCIASNYIQFSICYSKSINFYFSLQVIKKELVTDDEDIDWVQTEKHVFETASNHPFLVGLHSCFQVEFIGNYSVQYIDWVQTEKHVFETASNHPFLVGLHSCFQVEFIDDCIYRLGPDRKTCTWSWQ